MSRGSGSGGRSRGRGNSRRSSMTRQQKNHHSNQKNPNNPAHKGTRDNRSNQKNPNNPEHPSGWSERMSNLDSKKNSDRIKELE